MRLDVHLPNFSFSKRHSIQVAAPVDRAYSVARHLDFNDSRVIRTLFRLRGLPSRDLRLNALLSDGPGFALLEEQPPNEFVLGLMGRGVRPLAIESAEAFRDFAPSQGLRIGWNFSMRSVGDGTLVSTETRVQCFGATTRRIFRLYWLVVRPFSGWIRLEMLRTLKRQAEAG